MAGEAAAREPITVGTFCSGTDAPVFALRQAGIPHRHVFSAETNKHARTFIQANCPPETLYGDIMTLDLATVPRVDLFVAGPPCQPYSKMNPNRLCVSDSRVSVLVRCLQYVQCKSPTYCIFENVVPMRKFWEGGSASKKDDLFTESWEQHVSPTLSILGASYAVQTAVLDPIAFGCPQQRKRLYIVMIHKSQSQRFSFPPSIPLRKTYMDVLELELSHTDDEYMPRAWATGILRRVLSKRIGAKGIVNINVLSAQLSNNKLTFVDRDYSFCILSGSPSLVIERGRYLTRNELLKLQGFPGDEDTSCMSYLQTNRLIGNAMNVTVLEHLFTTLLSHITPA